MFVEPVRDDARVGPERGERLGGDPDGVGIGEQPAHHRRLRPEQRGVGMIRRDAREVVVQIVHQLHADGAAMRDEGVGGGEVGDGVAVRHHDVGALAQRLLQRRHHDIEIGGEVVQRL